MKNRRVKKEDEEGGGGVERGEGGGRSKEGGGWILTVIQGLSIEREKERSKLHYSTQNNNSYFDAELLYLVCKKERERIRGIKK